MKTWRKSFFFVSLLLHITAPFIMAQKIVERHQYLPQWSPDGKKYACVEVSGGEARGALRQWLKIYEANSQQERISLELNGLGQLAAELFPPDAVTRAEAQLVGLLPVFAFFSWAPDSEHYVFSNGKLSSTSLFQETKRYDLDLYVGNLQSAGLSLSKPEITQLTSDAVSELYPRWSPDGQFIAYARSGRIHLQKLLLHRNGAIEKVGTTLRVASPLIADEAVAMFPEWSPHSDKLAFSVYQNHDVDLYMYDVASEKVTPFTRTPQLREYHPVWSPDAEWLAFYSVQPDTQRPLSISIAKVGESRQPLPGIMSPISASLTMEQVSAAKTLDGYELQIAEGVRPNVILGPSWLPSGRHIVYIRESENFPIEVAEFNFSGIKKIQHLNQDTGTILNADIQCAPNEANLIFVHFVAAGGGVSYDNVKIHPLSQTEFTSPLIPIEITLFNPDDMPIKGAKVSINNRALGGNTDEDGKAIGWLRKTDDFPGHPPQYGIVDIVVDMPGGIQRRLSLPQSASTAEVEDSRFTGGVTIQPLKNQAGEWVKFIILAQVGAEEVVPKPVLIDFLVKDNAQKPLVGITITDADKIIGVTDASGRFHYEAQFRPGQKVSFHFSRSGWYHDQSQTVTIESRNTYRVPITMQLLTKTIRLEVVDEKGNPILQPEIRSTNPRLSITNTAQSITLNTELPPETLINGVISKSGYAPENISFYVPATPSMQIREVLQREKEIPLPHKGRARWGLWGRYATPIFKQTLSTSTEIRDGGAAIILRREGNFSRTFDVAFLHQLGFSQMKLEKNLRGGGSLSTTFYQPFIGVGVVKLASIEISGEAGLPVVQDRLETQQGSVIRSPQFSYATSLELKNSLNGFMGGGTIKIFLPASIVLYGSARYLLMGNIDITESLKANDYVSQGRSGWESEGGVRILASGRPWGFEVTYARVDLPDLHAGNIRFGIGLVY